VFPTTAALLGIWKAFDEMEQLGWVSGKRPKIIETSGGAPSSDGLKSLSEIVGASGGTILDLPREAVHTSLLDWARNEGVLLCPEGAAAAAGYAQLIDTGSLRPTDRVVLLNPASGLKYIDNVAEALHLKRPAAKQYPQRTAVGGIITPQ
ncbi:MAG TPA: threonine synthase, partial [Acidobacteriaceae bacterium]|nr:threonine synthase [Acidobacteriaceae bacterium]